MSKRRSFNKKEESQIFYKIGVNNQCPNCGYYCYRYDDDNAGCGPYGAILILNFLFWDIIDIITGEFYQDGIIVLGIISSIILVKIRQMIYPAKKEEFVLFQCTNCNYANNHKVL